MITYPNVKLNLGLRVLGKRPDGYHDIETLFVPYFGFHDILEINRSDVFSFRGNDVSWDNDLTIQAYELLKADFDLPPVQIILTKQIPVGAGLGGGSSDAAFAIKMLDEMFDLGLGDTRLASYAARLGSDCAFFIYNRPMTGRGRGEVLSPFDIDLSAFRIEVEVPQGISVNTRQAYAGMKPRQRETPIEEILCRGVETWKETLENDFEQTVFPAHPRLAAIKRAFYDKGALYASMSGSGSAIYGIFNKTE